MHGSKFKFFVSIFQKPGEINTKIEINFENCEIFSG